MFHGSIGRAGRRDQRHFREPAVVALRETTPARLTGDWVRPGRRSIVSPGLLRLSVQPSSVTVSREVSTGDSARARPAAYPSITAALNSLPAHTNLLSFSRSHDKPIQTGRFTLVSRTERQPRRRVNRTNGSIRITAPTSFPQTHRKPTVTIVQASTRPGSPPSGGSHPTRRRRSPHWMRETQRFRAAGLTSLLHTWVSHGL